MSLSLVYTRALNGISSPIVTVETHISNGIPGLSIVGLPETAVKESKDRVRSAIINAKFDFPTRKITVNLGPADLPKEGSRYDLAIAIGILAASKQISTNNIKKYIFIAELALSGQLRPVKGVLPSAIAAEEAHRHSLIIAKENSDEASFVNGLDIYTAHNLDQVCKHLNNEEKLPACIKQNYLLDQKKPVNLSDIKGQHQAKRALIISASGGHSLLFYGPPGSGKTLLANKLIDLLPELSEKQAREIAVIHSTSKQHFSLEKLMRRPFRTPHHTASHVALVGGGRSPCPGEISLAHHGVLFLDELPEFERRVLEVLREPLESGKIIISRAANKVEYPAKFQLIAAMNPCPCGHLGDERIPCRCSEAQIKRYRHKLSGPLLDRLDMHVAVKAISSNELINNIPTNNDEPLLNKNPIDLKETVHSCQSLQLDRQQMLNSQLDHKSIEKICILDSTTKAFMQQAMDKLGFSARIFHRVLKLARTIADLNSDSAVTISHLSEAMAFRGLDRLRYE